MNDNGTAQFAEFFVRADGSLELTSVRSGDEHGPHTIWDVDWSKTYGVYCFHMSGGGRFSNEASGTYWAASGLKVKHRRSALIDKDSRKRNKTRRLLDLPVEFEGMDLLKWLEHNAVHDETVWCDTCIDMLPSEQLCEHCWWCDEHGWYQTPTEVYDRCTDDYCRCSNAPLRKVEEAGK